MNDLTGAVPQGLPQPLHALILGGKGGIGAAVAETLLQAESTVAVTVTSRDRQWCHESTGDQRLQRMLVDLEAPQTIGALAEHLKGQAAPPTKCPEGHYCIEGTASSTVATKSSLEPVSFQPDNRFSWVLLPNTSLAVVTCELPVTLMN